MSDGSARCASGEEPFTKASDVPVIAVALGGCLHTQPAKRGPTTKKQPSRCGAFRHQNRRAAGVEPGLRVGNRPRPLPPKNNRRGVAHSGIKTAALQALSPGWRSGTARGREPRDGVSRPTGARRRRQGEPAGPVFLAGSRDCKGGGGEPPLHVHVRRYFHGSAVAR